MKAAPSGATPRGLIREALSRTPEEEREAISAVHLKIHGLINSAICFSAKKKEEEEERKE